MIDRSPHRPIVIPSPTFHPTSWRNADLRPPTITGCGAAVNGLQIVRLAHHAVVEQSELLAGRQLAAARVARKAGQMEDQLACPPHPVGGGDAATTLGAFGAEVSARRSGEKKPFCKCGKLTGDAMSIG